MTAKMKMGTKMGRGLRYVQILLFLAFRSFVVSSVVSWRLLSFHLLFVVSCAFPLFPFLFVVPFLFRNADAQSFPGCHIGKTEKTKVEDAGVPRSWHAVWGDGNWEP